MSEVRKTVLLSGTRERRKVRTSEGWASVVNMCRKPLPPREAHEYLPGDESRAGVLAYGGLHVICRLPPERSSWEALGRTRVLNKVMENT